MKHSIRANRVIPLALLFLAVCTNFLLILERGDSNNFLVYYTFGLNLVISFWNLMGSARKHAYSLELMFWIFNFIFFGVAALSQYFTHYKPYALVTDDDEIILCNIIILIWYLSFLTGRWIKNRCFPVWKESKKFYTINFQNFNIFVGVALVLAAYLIATAGISGLIFRGNRNDMVGNSSVLSSLIYHGVRGVILYTFAISLIIKKTNGKYKIITWILAIIFFISCFPTGISRYMSGSYYLGLFILFLGKKRDSVWFTLTFFLGLLLAFPLLDAFKYVVSFSDVSVNYLGRVFTNYYSRAHYDAHGMIISAMHYVKLFGYSGGKQLMGVILFFLPRSLWANKPIGSGAMAIESLQQYYFSNVSMPLVGEMFINFGIFGVVIGGVFLGMFIKKIDKTYWESPKEPFSFLNLTYPFITFYFFFMNRGDLMSTWAYTFANIFVGYMAWRFARKKYERKANE